MELKAQALKHAATPVKENLAASALKTSINRLGTLPTLPEAATKAMAVANDRNSRLADFSAIVERDPTLATGILKLANSALFRIGGELANLHQAVIRLGLRQCKNLIVSVGVRSLFNKVPAAMQQCNILWEHSLTVACLSRSLNKTLETGYQGEEFSCGLAHDIGRILFAIAAPDFFGNATILDFDEDRDILLREQSVLGVDHCSLGAWYAQRNQLPSALVSVIQHHHLPAKATAHQNLVGLVAMAEHMANYYQRTETTIDYPLWENPGWAFLSLNYDDGTKEKIMRLAAILIEDAVRETRESDAFQAA
jgi:HD-like signal output (HDOD) protein